MQFQISLRPIELSDIGPECISFPDNGEYERHFDAIVQDIESIDGVASATDSDYNKIHVDAPDLTLTAFKSALKPFAQYHFQHLRIVRIAELTDGTFISTVPKA